MALPPTPSALAVAVAGAAGRMGRAVLEAVLSAQNVRLVGAVAHRRHPELGTDAGSLVGRPAGIRLTDDANAAFEHAQVIVDFSAPDGTQSVLDAVVARGAGYVVGTTGLDSGTQAAIDEAAKTVPIVAAPNMSVGVQVLGHLIREALARLGPEFDVEIVEMHHRQKADAPSGTALRLGEIAAAARGTTLESVRKDGRAGSVGPRPSQQIGLHAVRGGDIVGDHIVVLAGPGERIELVHRAHSRAVFAAGALRAAQWVVGQPPGRYTMADVLGLG